MAALRAAAIAAAALALAGVCLPLPTRARTLRSSLRRLRLDRQGGHRGLEGPALALVRSLEPRDRVAALAFAGRTIARDAAGPAGPGLGPPRVRRP